MVKKATTRYFPSGEAKFAALLEDLKKAQHYIFMEYFIVQEGEMWNSIAEILIRKAAQGVEVRFLYDDMGCFLLLPPKYRRFLEENGIRPQIDSMIIAQTFLLVNYKLFCALFSAQFTNSASFFGEFV